MMTTFPVSLYVQYMYKYVLLLLDQSGKALCESFCYDVRVWQSYFSMPVGDQDEPWALLFMYEH